MKTPINRGQYTKTALYTSQNAKTVYMEIILVASNPKSLGVLPIVNIVNYINQIEQLLKGTDFYDYYK